MNNYESKLYLSSYDVQVVCADDLSIILKKAPIVDREYRHMRGKEVCIGSHFVFLQKDLQSSLIPSKISRNMIIRDSRTCWCSTDRDINMSIQESSQSPLLCVDITVYISYYKDAQWLTLMFLIHMQLIVCCLILLMPRLDKIFLNAICVCLFQFLPNLNVQVKLECRF